MELPKRKVEIGQFWRENFTVFYISSFFISWQGVFNTTAIEESILARSVLVVIFLFCIEFVLKILLSVLQALQLYAYADIIGITAQICGLIGIYIVSNTTEPSIVFQKLWRRLCSNPGPSA